MTQTWYERVIAIHTAVTNSVSHVRRLKSDRYFVWEEDDRTDLTADNVHAEIARTIVTDLFTKIEFDEYVDDFEESLHLNECSYSYDFVDYEPDTGFFHHQWRWVLNG